MVRHFSLALLTCLLLSGCSPKQPAPPDTEIPSGDIQVSGSERIAWNQLADDSAQLALLHYVAYVDGVRTVLAEVSCGGTVGAAGFECAAALPPLTAGRHSLEIAAVLPGAAGELESDRSQTIWVFMGGLTGRRTSTRSTVATAEGVILTLEQVAEGLRDPSDLAFTGEGTILVAERGGTVRAVREGEAVLGAALDLSSEVTAPRGGLLGMALDPRFDETGVIYVLYAADAPRKGLEFVLARFRGVQGQFAERATLLDRVAADPDGASGAVRIGPDAKLYVALDSASDAATPASFSSYNGKVLRLNLDATTPGDQAMSSPIYSFDHPEPKALDWHPHSGDLWVIDSVSPTGGRLRRAVSRSAYTLPQGTGASAATFYRGALMPMFSGNLFIAAEAGRQLMRLQFDPADATRLVSVERLLTDEIGPVRVVAEGREGALYIASDTALYRLTP